MAVDYNTNLGKVRLSIGDVIEPYLLDDALITAILDKYIAEGKTDAHAVWYTTIECLMYLKSQYAQSAARRREREGSVEVEEYSNQKYEAICDLLDYWKNNPPTGITPAGFARFTFGGTVKSEVDRVDNDPESNKPSDVLGEDEVFYPDSFRGE